MYHTSSNFGLISLFNSSYVPVGCPKSLYLTLFMHESDPAHYLKSFDEFLATCWLHKQNTNAYNRFTALTSSLFSVLI